MSLCQHLRRYDDTRASLDRQLANHPGSVIIEPPGNQRYVYIALTNSELGEAWAILNLDEWLAQINASLPGMPWLNVPLSYLLRWLDEMQMRFIVQDSAWEVQHLAAVDDDLPSQMLLMPAQPCSLMCLHWPQKLACQEAAARLALAAVTFELDYVLGNSSLPLSMLTDIAIDDLLLIKQYQPRLKIGQHNLFNFIYNHSQEIIVEQQLNDLALDVRGEEEVLFQWMQLPINIEFVLDSQTVTLAELEEIHIGSVLSVNATAEQRVKIYLNRKLFALGELVALDDGKLAVEINQMSPQANTVIGGSDVE